MTKSASPSETKEALGSFDIFILGTRSSGKSVLLASLYQKLSVLNWDTNFFARCDDDKQNDELRETYIQLLDTQSDWPSGTYRTDSFDLSCYYQQRSKGVRLFSIRFHDYPGGYVTDHKVNEFINERIDQCSTVMALIDGRKMLDRLLDQETNPAHSLHRDLDDLVRVLQRCVGKPIHFILTKSDLFQNVNFPLKVIAAELRRHGGFNNICMQQKETKDTCYLIPVSAVGSKFAHIDPADGRIKKLRNGTIDPFNLEVMLGASIVDTVLELARTDIESSAKDGAGPRTLAARLPPWLGKTLMYLRLIAPAAGSILGHLTALGITGICLGAEKYIDNKRLSYDQKVREIRQTIHNRTSAIEAILKIQMQLLDGWLKSEPASTLGARFDLKDLLIQREPLEGSGSGSGPTDPPASPPWLKAVSIAAITIGLVIPNRSAIYNFLLHANGKVPVVCTSGKAGAPTGHEPGCRKPDQPQPPPPPPQQSEMSTIGPDTPTARLIQELGQPVSEFTRNGENGDKFKFTIYRTNSRELIDLYVRNTRFAVVLSSPDGGHPDWDQFKANERNAPIETLGKVTSCRTQPEGSPKFLIMSGICGGSHADDYINKTFYFNPAADDKHTYMDENTKCIGFVLGDETTFDPSACPKLTGAPPFAVAMSRNEGYLKRAAPEILEYFMFGHPADTTGNAPVADDIKSKSSPRMRRPNRSNWPQRTVSLPDWQLVPEPDDKPAVYRSVDRNGDPVP